MISRRHVVLIVFGGVVGLALNLGWIASLDERLYWTDESWYCQFARNLVDGRKIEDPTIRAPGAAYFLAAWMSFGGSWLFWRLSNVFLAVISSFLMFRIARRLYSNRSLPWAGALLCLVYPFFVYQRGFFLSENLTIPCMLLAVWALLRATNRDALGPWILAGATAGLTNFVRPVFLLMPIAVPVMLVIVGRRDWRSVVAKSFLFTGAFGLFIVALLGRSYVLTGRVELTSRGSTELYKGVATPPGEAVSTFRGETDRNPFRFVRQNFGQAVRNKLFYTVRFWAPVVDNVENARWWHSLLASAILLPLYALAMIGWSVCERKGRVVLLSVLIAYWALHVFAVVKFRYRIPIDSLLIVFALGGGLRVSRFFSRWFAPRAHFASRGVGSMDG